jgi:ribosome-associated protein
MKKKFQWEADSGLERDAPLPHRGRSRAKREAKAVEDLVDELMKLGEQALTALPINDDVRDALTELHRLDGARGGRRRQRLRVAGKLRHVDVVAVCAALPEHGGVSPRELGLRQVERWRTRLLTGGDEVLDELLTEHPEADRQRLRQLIRQARKDSARTGERGPKAARELFAVLRALEDV